MDPALGYRSEYSIQNTEQSLFETQNTEYKMLSAECMTKQSVSEVDEYRLQNTECRTDHCQP